MMGTPWIIGIDLETTGIDHKRHRILEIGAIIVDTNLNIVDEYTQVIKNDPKTVRALMDAYVTDMHTSSGLLEEISAGDGVPLQDAESDLEDFVHKHFRDRRPVVFGSSVGFDRKYLEHFMPDFNENSLHYRNIDVSTVKELARVFRPELLDAHVGHEATHRALADIKDSLDELRGYREEWLRSSSLATQ